MMHLLKLSSKRRTTGEDGLAGEPVSVWIYEGTLKIEYQTTALSLYEF